LRDAQQYHSVEPPVVVADSSCIAAATKTSVTYYKSNNSSDTVKLWLNGTDLSRTADGSTKVVLSHVQSLEFQYYKVLPDSGGNLNYNNNDSLVSATTAINAPTATERPLLVKIKIIASVNNDGYSRELACLVRLRNSPYKLKL